jgi:hypothetical protein
MKCIDCEFAVMSVVDPKNCKCWWIEPEKREIKNAMTEIKCNGFKLGAMDNVKKRIGWKP